MKKLFIASGVVLVLVLVLSIFLLDLIGNGGDNEGSGQVYAVSAPAGDDNENNAPDENINGGVTPPAQITDTAAGVDIGSPAMGNLFDPGPKTTIYLENNDPYPEGNWHFVLTGVEQSNLNTDSSIQLYVIWSGTNITDGPYTGVLRNRQVDFYVRPSGDSVPVIGETYAYVPGGYSGILLVSNNTPTPPVPEAPTIVLLVVGATGMGAFFLLRKKRHAAMVS